MVKFEARAKVLLKFLSLQSFQFFIAANCTHFFFNQCRGAELENLRFRQKF